MKAIEIKTYGGPEVLQVVDAPMPVPSADEILVKVAAAGINFTDIGFREGTFGSTLPRRLGKEACGTVVAMGKDVQTIKIGDRVAATLLDGAYAEFVSGPEKLWVSVPDGIEDATACAAMMQGMTAHYLTHDVYTIKSGDTVLFTAATSGVNSFSIPIAKSVGAKVIAVVTNASKVAFVEQLGADFVIDTSSQNLEDEVRKITDGLNVDVVYDSVGKDLFPRLIPLVKARGAAVLYGASSGKLSTFDTSAWLFYSINMIAPSIENYISDRSELESRAAFVFEGFLTGLFKSPKITIFPLAEAIKAHRLLGDRSHSGKLVLVP